MQDEFNFWYRNKTLDFPGGAFEDFDPKIWHNMSIIINPWLTGVMTEIVCSVYMCGKDLKKPWNVCQPCIQENLSWGLGQRYCIALIMRLLSES